MRLKIRTKLILSYCLVAGIPLLGILALPAVDEFLLRYTVEAKLQQAGDDLYGFLEAKRALCQELADRIVADATFQRLSLNFRPGEADDYIRGLLPDRDVQFRTYAADQESLFASIPESLPGSAKVLKMGPVDESRKLHVTFGKAPFHFGDRFLAGLFVYYPVLLERPAPSGEPVQDMLRPASVALRDYSEVWREIVYSRVVPPADEEAYQQAAASAPEAATHIYEQHKPTLVSPSLLSATEEKPSQVKQSWLHMYMPLVDVFDEFSAIVIVGLPLVSLRAFYQKTMVYMLLFSGVATLVALLAGTYFSSSISRRIGLLARGARKVSEGNLDFEIRDPVHDELGALASTFNTMTRRLDATLADLRQRTALIEEKNRLLDQMVSELTHIREFTENVLSQVGSGVFTVDPGGRITQVNPACLQLFAPQESEESLLGQPLGRLVPPGPLAKRIGDLLLHPEPVSHWETTQRVGARKLPLEVSISPLEIKDETHGLVVTVRDLSVIRGLEESVRRSEKLAALGHLSAGMAHEIRNPLGIIKGSAELLERNFAGDEDARDLARYIIDESVRLSRTLQDFLDFARPREPSLEPTAINAVLQKTVPLADHHPLRDRIGLELDLEEALPDLQVDAAQCQQVFLNLLLNAFEASPHGGLVRISSRLDAARDQVVIRVQDHGSGISEEALASIFNPFFTTKTHGTGLGLSIVHRIMESHHASIDVESRPGEGTTFTLRFPVSRVSAPTRPVL